MTREDALVAESILRFALFKEVLRRKRHKKRKLNNGAVQTLGEGSGDEDGDGDESSSDESEEEEEPKRMATPKAKGKSPTPVPAKKPAVPQPDADGDVEMEDGDGAGEAGLVNGAIRPERCVIWFSHFGVKDVLMCGVICRSG